MPDRPDAAGRAPGPPSADAAAPAWRSSIWLADDPRDDPLFTLPSPSDHFDAIVLGAGLAGLLTAVELTDEGARVLVLEARRAAERTTGHSTAKITALHGAVYHQLRAGKGLDAAQSYATANQEAVQRLRQLVQRLGIECGLGTSVAYTCSRTAEGAATIAEELEAAAAAGLPVYGTSETDLPWPVHSAVALPDQAFVDPVALCAGLVAHLRGRGVTVVEGLRATAVEEDADRCTVRVGDAVLHGSVVVQATHLPITDPALIAGRTRPERSYVVAGPMTGGGGPDGAGLRSPLGMYLDVAEGWSIRPLGLAPEQAAWLLVGGEGHPMHDHVDGTEHLAALGDWAQQQLGVDVRHRWSAFDYTATDGVPFIGRLGPGCHRRFVATGFAKWGMSTSMVAATLLRDAVSGRDNAHAQLFDAARVTPTLGVDAVRNNTHVAIRFVGDRLTALRRTEGDLQPGGGIVVTEGLRPVAVGRDLDGTVHRLDATCTHMGCVVRFNAAERTWDCPCHGSRFAIDGAVIDGPATSPLAPTTGADDAEEPGPAGSTQRAASEP